jgi:hypothetical protein
LQENATVSTYLQFQAGERNADKLREQHSQIVEFVAQENPELNKDEISTYIAMYSGLSHLEYREREQLLTKHSKRADVRNKYQVASYLASQFMNNTAKTVALAEQMLNQTIDEVAVNNGVFNTDSINKIDKAANILDRASNPAKIAVLANIQEKQIALAEESPQFHINLEAIHQPLAEKNKKLLKKGKNK